MWLGILGYCLLLLCHWANVAVPNTGRLLSAWIFFVCFCFEWFVRFVMATPGCSINAAKNEKKIVFVPTVIRKNPPKLKNSSRITY